MGTRKNLDLKIEFNLYGMDEYTVQYCGDDVIFFTEKEAKDFIDEIRAS